MKTNAFLTSLLVMGLTASSWGFSIKPGAQVVRVNAGGSVTATFEVVNDQDAPLSVSCRLRDSFVLPENKNFPVNTWLDLTVPKLVVPAKSSKKVDFKVHPPKGATGELAGLVSFVPESKEPEKKPEVKPAGGIETKIVTLITVSLYARIKGTEKGEADLGDLRIQNLPSRGTQAARIESSIVVKNSGNVHQRPSGVTEIFKKGEAKPLQKLEFPSGWPVMPYSDNPYTAYVDGALPAGDYLAKTHVSFTPQVGIDKQVSFSVLGDGNTTNYHEIP